MRVMNQLRERSAGLCEINLMDSSLKIPQHPLDWRAAAHHIEKKGMGCSKRRRQRLDVIDNLVLLCGACHAKYGHGLKESEIKVLEG